jgi:predicted nucleotidyltransferase
VLASIELLYTLVVKLIANFESFPQLEPLIQLLPKLEASPDIHAVWLSGSFARGNADTHSDVDLRVAVSSKNFDVTLLPPELASLETRAAAIQRRAFGDKVAWHYLMLEDSTIYDILVYRSDAEPFPETRHVLFAKLDWVQKLESGTNQSIEFPSAKPETVKALLEGFWINWRKHAKVSTRSETLTAWLGERLSRHELIQLKFMVVTGLDCGAIDRLTIHTAAIVAQALKNWDVDQIPFLELANETSKLGHELAEKLGFEYPTRAEMAARNAWVGVSLE